MKLGLAIQQVQEAERELADALDAIGKRHRTDHEVYHLTRTLAGFSRSHVAALAPFAERYPLLGHPDGDAEPGMLGRLRERLTAGVLPTSGSPGDADQGPLDMLREKTSEAIGRQPLSGLLLLRDLRALYLHASEACIDWVILDHGAEAAKDRELLRMVRACHGETERTLKWAETTIKTVSPQVLMT